MRSTGQKIHDVVIVGAGAAGLACAQELSRLGLSFVVLEGRGRAGGRVCSLAQHAGSAVELGAEFVHGKPAEILRRLERARQPFLDVCDHHLFLRKGELRPIPDFFGKIGEVVGKINARKRQDRSVSGFLDSVSLRAEKRSLFTSFVEGFHAADLNLMGEKGLAVAEEGEESALNGSSLFRLPHGYGKLMQAMADSLPPRSLRLRSKVLRVGWEPGLVRVLVRREWSREGTIVLGRRLVLTAPLPALQAGEIEISPEVPGLAGALNALEMGHVQRLALRFRRRFWESLSSGPVSFLHAGPERYFPTWWSAMPLRSPWLTAWQGGPKAFEMASWSLGEKTGAALATLSLLSGKSQAFLRGSLEEVSHHDWARDPWSRGAYSYLLADGLERSRRLEEPFAETIFVAGEATAPGAARGTVHGALRSGTRAAQQAAGALRSRHSKEGVEYARARRKKHAATAADPVRH